MFEGVLPLPPSDEELDEHGASAFGALVDKVTYAMARGAVREGDPVDTAQQIWSVVHGAVTLELKGLVLTPDPEATYLRLLDLIIRGVAPTPG